MEETQIILLLGGSGYIGTHLMLELHGKPSGIDGGRFQVAIIDQVAPHAEALKLAERTSGGLPVLFHARDLQTKVDASWPSVPYCAIMLAARRDVNEGEEKPYEYIGANVALCVNSMEYLAQLGVKRLIQASSAAVYHSILVTGEPFGVYGYSKKITEDICRRLLLPNQRLLVLRYMNPVGSHPEVDAFPKIGVCKVIARMKPEDVFENRGDCIRDYIHITDLASFHSAALKGWDRLFSADTQMLTLDVGTGIGTSVSQLLACFGNRKSILVDKAHHEGYNTVGDMAKIARMLPEWWWGKPRKSLEDCVADHLRISATRLHFD